VIISLDIFSCNYIIFLTRNTLDYTKNSGYVYLHAGSLKQFCVKKEEKYGGYNSVYSN
jgi:hypothetical protein